MVVFPCSMTNFDFSTLASSSESYLERNPVRSVDAARINLKKPEGAISALEFWANKDSKVIDLLSSAEASLEHYFVGFIFYATKTELQELAAFTGKEHSFCHEETGMIISASLGDWKFLITKKRQSNNVRAALNQVQGFLEQAGLSAIFSSHRKHILKDGTYLLERK